MTSAMNSFIRPLAVHYVDAFEKQCQTQQIPAKFRPQPDNYQKRNRKQQTDQDSLSINQMVQEVNAPQPQEPTRKTIYTLQEMTEQIVSMQKIDISRKNIKTKTVTVAPQTPAYQSLLCCQAETEESEMCQKCFESICSNCQHDIESVRTHTKCLQRLCGECKRILKIDFPNYSIRNYPITLKNFTTLHFLGCTCPECTKD